MHLGKAYGRHTGRCRLLLLLEQDTVARLHVPEWVGRAVLRDGDICFDLYQGLTPVKRKNQLTTEYRYRNSICQGQIQFKASYIGILEEE